MLCLKSDRQCSTSKKLVYTINLSEIYTVGAEVAKQYDIPEPTYKLTTSLFSSHPSDAFMVQMQMKLWLRYYLASI